MPLIELTTNINAPIDTCFDAARDVQVHELSMIHTNERAVAGRTSGLCELGDEITWEATHFGIKQKLTARITKMDPPFFFEDIMLKGAFKSMRHEHHFEMKDGHTVMKDVFNYEAPLGILGNIFSHLVLTKYMRRFLMLRNKVIKEVAENITNQHDL